MCGIECNLFDPCTENPTICENGGTCMEICTDFADYKCECTEGYIGKNCTQEVS